MTISRTDPKALAPPSTWKSPLCGCKTEIVTFLGLTFPRINPFGSSFLGLTFPRINPFGSLTVLALAHILMMLMKLGINSQFVHYYQHSRNSFLLIN